MAKKYISKIVTKGGQTLYVKDEEARQSNTSASTQTCEDIIDELT